MKSRIQLAIEQENEIEKIVQSITVYDGVDYCGSPHPANPQIKCIRVGGKCTPGVLCDHLGIRQTELGNQELIQWRVRQDNDQTP